MRFPEILTPRLHLRAPTAEDFSGWRNFYADPGTMLHLGGVQHEADAWRSLAGLIGIWHLQSFGMFSVLERSTGGWVGRVGPWSPYLWPVREVGWGISRRYEGRGYALEAAVACIDFAFEQLGWERVSHLIADANQRSRVLAERLGSQRIGPARMPGHLERFQVTEWGQSREDWLARRAAYDELVPR